jgi:hypothetical protein
MAIGFVQAEGTGSSFGGSPITQVYTNANVLGDCLVVIASVQATSGNVSSISDTSLNTWVNLIQDFQCDPSSASVFLSVWACTSCKAAGAGTNTVSVAFSKPIPFGNDLIIAEYSGVSGVEVFGIQNTASSPFSTPTKTTTGANDWILSLASGNGSGQPSVSTVGYSVRENETAGRDGLLLVDSNGPKSAGSYFVTFTSAGAVNTAGLIALSAPASGGGGGMNGSGMLRLLGVD